MPDDIAEAAALVREVITELEPHASRGVLGCVIGQNLSRRGARGLHHQFGYDKLPDFIAANCPEFVIVDDDRSPDFLVARRGQTSNRAVRTDAGVPVGATPERGGSDTPKTRVVLRADIWRAFAHVNDSRLRFYDTQEGVAVTLSRNAAPNEPEQTRALRERTETDAARYVPIPGATESEFIEQIRALAESLAEGDPRRHLVADTISAAEPHRAFLAATRINPGIREAWAQRWSEFVLLRISEWTQKHGLEIPNLFVRPVAKAMRQSMGARTGPGTARWHVRAGRASSGGVRERALRILTQLPLAELLSIRVRLEDVLGDEDER